LTRAWISYGQAKIPLALEQFGRIAKRDPARYGYLRFTRASAFVNLAQYDSAASQLDSLLAQLRRQDEVVIGNGYQSKELLEYAVGLIHLQLRRTSAAREAFARSLVENTGFAPSHAKLGELAAAAGDTTAALSELSMAVEIDPNDPLLQVGYGRALMLANRPGDAVRPLRQAVTIAPGYAEPYLYLAVALETSGDAAGARTAFSAFLERTKRADDRRTYAEEKVKSLAAPTSR
jgi:predicted Zn-dependent protease